MKAQPPDQSGSVILAKEPVLQVCFPPFWILSVFNDFSLLNIVAFYLSGICVWAKSPYVCLRERWHVAEICVFLLLTGKFC